MISVTKKPTYMQYLNIGNNISTGHMVNVAIVRYKVCAPGFREQVQWRADSGLGMERPGFKS